MNDLARIMQWRQQGLLSDSEFLAAKRAVGLQRPAGVRATVFHYRSVPLLPIGPNGHTT